MAGKIVGTANLVNFYSLLDEEVKTKLKEKENEHAPTKGTETEEIWKDFLKKCLPKRYTVGSGFAIDNKNKISEQIDIIIYDRHFTPWFYKPSSKPTNYCPVECVYAVFEVKQAFNQELYNEAVEKFESVKKLEMTTGLIKDVNDEKKKSIKERKILGGMIAERMESKKEFEKKPRPRYFALP